MKESIKPLFGFPVYHSKIDKKKYDKKKILKTISKNFKKSELRDNWSYGDFDINKMHHSLWDESNKEFETPDYSSLIPIYNKEIEKYFKLMPHKAFRYTFKIVNYTCMTEGHHMMGHIHTECDFSAIHYLKFKDEPTVFRNTNDYAKFTTMVYPQLGENFLPDKVANSWAFKHFKIDTEEDDLIIFPAMLEHSVPEIKTKETRVTIAFNIKITEGS
jgi:uncharacterized protein (TIGR02466 family)